MEPVKIPRLIDEPPNVLLWTVDELAPLMIGLVGGILTGNLMLGLLIGAGITSVYKRFRDGRPDGYLLHSLYWIGLIPTRAKTIVNPFSKHFLP